MSKLSELEKEKARILQEQRDEIDLASAEIKLKFKPKIKAITAQINSMKNNKSKIATTVRRVQHGAK
jgi:hypothetical protein